MICPRCEGRLADGMGAAQCLSCRVELSDRGGWFLVVGIPSLVGTGASGNLAWREQPEPGARRLELDDRVVVPEPLPERSPRFAGLAFD